MNDTNLPPLPEPAFRLKWRDGAYKVTKPHIGDTDVYTADQLRAAILQERESAADLVLRELGDTGQAQAIAAAIREGDK